MSDLTRGNRLDRPVDDKFDHILGPADAAITLVEYGSYACPYCRAANERIAEVRDQFGDRMRYVFRHRPSLGSSLPDAPPNWSSAPLIRTASGTNTSS
jgi:Na+:H+ antiporter, NhaA family